MKWLTGDVARADGLAPGTPAWRGSRVPPTVVTAAFMALAAVGCASAETPPARDDTTSSSEDDTTSAQEPVQSGTDAVAPVDASLAIHYGVENPPDVVIVRPVAPEEKQPLIDECLREAGFVVEGPGRLYYPEEQADAAGLAQYTCQMQYPTAERYSRPWRAPQMRIQYAWTVEFVVPCLEDQGHPITDIPDEKGFMDSWEADPFYPFAQVVVDVPVDDFNAEWARLEATCPQTATSRVLWDGMSIDRWRDSR